MLQLQIGGKSIYWNLHASWAHMHLPGVNVYKYLYSDGSEDSLWVSLVVRSPQMTAYAGRRGLVGATLVIWWFSDRGQSSGQE